MDHTNYFFTPSIGYLQLLVTSSDANSGRVILYPNLTDDLQSNEITLSSDLPQQPHRCVLTYSAGTSALINWFPYVFRECMCSHSTNKINITFQSESLVQQQLQYSDNCYENHEILFDSLRVLLVSASKISKIDN